MTHPPQSLKAEIEEIVGMVASDGSTSGVATEAILKAIELRLEELAQPAQRVGEGSIALVITLGDIKQLLSGGDDGGK